MEKLTDNSGDSIDEITKKLFEKSINACNSGIKIGQNNKGNYCLKHIENVCKKTRDHIKKPINVEREIKSQGVPWLMKNFIFSSLRLMEGSKPLQSLLSETDEDYNRVMNKYLTADFKETFNEWQETSKSLLEESMLTLRALDYSMEMPKIDQPSQFEQDVQNKVLVKSKILNNRYFLNVEQERFSISDILNDITCSDPHCNSCDKFKRNCMAAKGQNSTNTMNDTMLGVKTFLPFANFQYATRNASAIQKYNKKPNMEDFEVNKSEDWEAAKQSLQDSMEDKQEHNKEDITNKGANKKLIIPQFMIKKIGKILVENVENHLWMKISSFGNIEIDNILKVRIIDVKKKIKNNHYKSVYEVVEAVESIYTSATDHLKTNPNENIQMILEQSHKSFKLIVIHETYMNKKNKKDRATN